MYGLTDLMAQQAELTLDILYSVCDFQHKVPLTNNPMNFY